VIRRIIAIVLIVLGLSMVGTGIASATIWKPSSTVTVPLPEQPQVNYVISDPGVLTIVNPTVKIRAVAQGDTPVYLGIGRTDDVEAWVAPSDHGRITGLSNWDALTYEVVDAEVDDSQDEEDEDAEEGDDVEEDANPADSDMWVDEVTGKGEVTYTWEEVPGQWSIIFATDGSEPAPMVEFTWEREVPTPALIPLVIIGAITTIIGIIMLVLALRAGIKPRDDHDPEDDGQEAAPLSVEEEDAPVATPEQIMASIEAEADDEAQAPTESPITAQPVAALDYPHQLEEVNHQPEEPPLTRREIRERERARERAMTLGVQDAGDDDRRQWPTQDEPEDASQGEKHRGRRRWWQRGRKREHPPAPGPIIIDDDTGEIIVTGEIDVSRLAPQATADSWRATWGLDKDTPTRWIPVMKSIDDSRGEGSDE